MFCKSSSFNEILAHFMQTGSFVTIVNKYDSNVDFSFNKLKNMMLTSFYMQTYPNG